jgi:hypothetical protein
LDYKAVSSLGGGKLPELNCFAGSVNVMPPVEIQIMKKVILNPSRVISCSHDSEYVI